MFTCSASQKSFGQILNVNNGVKKILQYSKRELVGQHLSKIMPSVIGEYHDIFVRKCLEKQDLEFAERKVFSKDKNGFLIHMVIKNQILPIIEDGMQIIGLLWETPENKKVFY